MTIIILEHSDFFYRKTCGKIRESCEKEAAALREQYEMGDTSRQKNGLYTGLPSSELLPFRLISFGAYLCDSQYYTEREGQGNFLFLGTISGCGELRYRGRRTLLQPGRAAVIDCYRYQYYATWGEKPWRFVWMHFSGAAAAAFVQMLNGEGLREAALDPRWAEDFFPRLEEYAGQPGRFTDLTVSLWIHQFLNELAQSADSRSGGRYQREMLEIAAYLRENLDKPLRVADLAARCGLSEFHFLRVFKSAVGQPPYEYLTLLRMNQAKQLLAFTEESVAEVAQQVGYSDAKALIDNFKRHTGETPAKFRRQVREQEGYLR